ncbi:protein BIG GRAIN 1-like B [Impatiens glandulifera]|uniref:protein BIG GRAIN 1-like B n=1 Tax=Impatiens glandulifera TaxID=253017 RepID=UPI001FB087F5|nr:protein BIG GRAIN 1-like B [Impatiens glandulifera]
MYSLEKSLKRNQSRKHHPNPPLSSSTIPSFSSTLLDEIYSSIDIKPGGLKLPHEKTSTRRRQSLPEYYNPNPISSWTSSDSSSGDMGSPAVYKPRTSCFTGAPNLMKIKTIISDQPDNKSPQVESKPKSMISALKMYSNLKKVKNLPVSPGIRFTNFMNTLFRHGNSRKSTKQSKSTQDSSTCSSATSFYRSCLANKRENEPINNGGKRTVRFNPVSVIVDDDCSGNDSDKFGRRTYGGNSNYQELNLNRKLVDIRCYSREVEEDDDDDSDTSSDLFELDHLTFMGSFERDYREELPVMKLPTSMIQTTSRYV